MTLARNSAGIVTRLGGHAHRTLSKDQDMLRNMLKRNKKHDQRRAAQR